MEHGANVNGHLSPSLEGKLGRISGNVEDGLAKNRAVQATEAILHHALFLEDRKCRHRVHVADDASKVRHTAKDGARNPVLSPVKGDK